MFLISQNIWKISHSCIKWLSQMLPKNSKCEKFSKQLLRCTLKASSICALLSGIFVSASLIFFQHEIKSFVLKRKNKWAFYFVSRLFTIVRFYFDLLMWKGIWGFFNYIVGSAWQVSLACFLSASCLLFLVRSFKTSIATPMGIGIDRPKLYITVATYLSSQVTFNFQVLLLKLQGVANKSELALSSNFDAISQPILK